MRWEDTKQSIKNFLFEFRHQKIGIFGVIVLAILLITAVFAPLIATPEAKENWRNMAYWDENPVNAPPAWMNYFTSKDMCPHVIMDNYEEKITDLGGGIKQDQLIFVYNYKYDIPPTDLTFKGELVYYNSSKPPTINMSILRPDGKTIKLYSAASKTGKPEDDHYVAEINVLVTASDTAKKETYNFGRDFETEENLEKVLSPDFVKPMSVIFSKTEPGILLESADPLKGEYKLLIDVFYFDERDNTRSAKSIFAGKVYGLLGTEKNRRDLFQGIVWGLRWALALGLLVAVLSVSIGISFGITSAYLGGWKDELMQRFNEGVASLPFLPILILVAAAFKPSIWNIIILMSALYWTGTAKVARSMGLQIKEETYVEAARCLGARDRRIIIKHMIPQVMPYAFANMALSVPSALLTEAGLSFLGLGDTTVITWGQILYDAQFAGATLKGLWWWVIPPGLAIAIVGLTFVMIGTALDTVLNPKMKRM